ncbi:unnamed protein product, partial [Adineta steineri]
RDRRDGYNFTQSEPSAGNYYPIVTGILMKDKKQDLQMSVVTDRAQGGGSIRDGQIEIMIHRRVSTDDSLGVSETLNEMGIDNQGLVIRGRHLLALTKIEDGIKFFREHALKSVWKPIIAFRNDVNNEPLNYKPWSLLKSELPPQINILTIEPLTQENNILTILFRVEHFYEPNEHSTLSKTVSIQIDKIFKNHKVHEAKEVTLGANMDKSQAFERLKWKLDSTYANKKGHEEIPIRSTRTTKYRLQIAILIIAVSSFGLLISTPNHENNTHVEKQVFVPEKIEPVDDVPVVETTPPEPTNCAYRVYLDQQNFMTLFM